MDSIWVAIVVLVAFFVILRLRNRRKGKPQEPQPYMRRIDGYQVDAYLHPRMSRACLFDNGIQYGKGFRRKEGPALPHDELCRCRATPFSFTSNEVFNGALRSFSGPISSIPDLPPERARALADALKQVERKPVPEEAEDYVDAVMTTLEPTDQERGEFRTFLHERHAYLTEQDDQGQGSAPGDTQPSDDIGAAKTS